MRGSTLIHSGKKEDRQKEIKKIIENELEKPVELKNSETLPDIKIVEPDEDKNSIGIGQSREIIKFLSEKPFNLDLKIVVILEAHKMTSQAQNALLKTLEEPPAYALIILSSKTERALLETVASRCRKISIKTKKHTNTKDEKGRGVNLKKWSEIKKLSPGDRLDIAYQISREEKSDIIAQIEAWTEDEREFLLKDKNQKNAQNLELLFEILETIENTNVNKRLALETLFVTLQ